MRQARWPFSHGVTALSGALEILERSVREAYWKDRDRGVG